MSSHRSPPSNDHSGPAHGASKRVSFGLVGLAFLLALVALALLSSRAFYPHHRLVAALVYGISWIPLLIALRRHRESLSRHRERAGSWLAGYRGYLAPLAGMLLLGYLVWVLFPVEQSPFPDLEDEVIVARAREDIRLAVWVDGRMHRLLDQFARGDRIVPGGVSGGPEWEALLRNLWSEFLESCFELDLLKARYRTFYRINPITRAEPHAAAFLAGYGAFVMRYESALRLTELVGDNATVKTILNEANSAAGVPAGAFTVLQSITVHPETLVQLNAGRAYLGAMEERLEQTDAGFLSQVRAHLRGVDQVLGDNPGVFVANPLDYFEGLAFSVWFPVQKNVALQMSHLRTTDRPYFISRAAIGRYADQLAPGDILVQRREWHVTNLGIPGFWTHAALFVGTPESIDREFEGMPLLRGETPMRYLRRRVPRAVEALGTPDSSGSARVVLEALGQGVMLQSLEESGHCDSLAAVRPKVSREDRFRALLMALYHYGKPYDFNFDFTTDNELVCSELIYKAYRGARGFTLRPTVVNGRLLFAPNELIRKFDLEHDSRRPELDFVLFLDGDGKSRRFEERERWDLRASWRRPKWHILLE